MVITIARSASGRLVRGVCCAREACVEKRECRATVVVDDGCRLSWFRVHPCERTAAKGSFFTGRHHVPWLSPQLQRPGVQHCERNTLQHFHADVQTDAKSASLAVHEDVPVHRPVPAQPIEGSHQVRPIILSVASVCAILTPSVASTLAQAVPARRVRRFQRLAHQRVLRDVWLPC